MLSRRPEEAMLKLADVDVLGWAVPPRTERMALRPGDLAELVFVERLSPSLGKKRGKRYVRASARVTNVLRPGRYEGELEDGSPVRFSAGHILGIHGPEMAGIFDWLLRRRPSPPPPPPSPAPPGMILPGVPTTPQAPPLPSALVPAPPSPPVLPSLLSKLVPPPPPPPGAILPVAPAPPPPAESVAPVKKWISKLFQPRPPGEAPPEPGLFAGVFAPQAEVAPPPSELIPVKEEEPTAPIFAPPPPGAPMPFFGEGGVIVGPPVGAEIPMPPSVADVPPPTPEAPVSAEQLALWNTIFPETPPTVVAPEAASPAFEKAAEPVPVANVFTGAAPEVPIQEYFQPFSPHEVVPEEQIRRALPPGAGRRHKVLPLPPRATLFPNPYELARAFITRYAPIEELWKMLHRVRMDPEFIRRTKTPEGATYAFETLGVCGGRPDWIEETASFFHIPWEELDRRAGKELTYDDQGNEYEAWVNVDAIFFEILAPLQEVVYQAFELIKPPDLPGVFTLQWLGSGEHRCQLALTYMEGGGPIAPGDVRPPPQTQITEEEYERMLEEERARLLQEYIERQMAKEATRFGKTGPY